jgi:tetratricopeptide (TPR) repeat protein
MAYQKSKHVESAQKFLSQGKIQQAVAEYLIVLKHEPKDQVTLMTVGDLFVRQGETFQALEYFERLAQIYLADGFLTKAIAIYKKITKLAPEEMRPIERLADLYVQQGVMSEARPIYLQMAEMHQKAHRPQQAVGLLRKLLDAEPDNARVQSRLADLLVSTGQSADAANVLRIAAQQVFRRGDHAEALKLIDRTLKLDAADTASLALRARVLAASGKHSEAVQMLESLNDAEAGGETSSLLVELHVESGELEQAGALVEKIYASEPKHFTLVQQVAAALVDRGEYERALPLLQRINDSAIEHGEHERQSELLGRIVEAFPDRVEAHAALVNLFKRTSDSFRLPDALIHLAEAHEAAGQLDAAMETYGEFLQREPENDTVRRKLEQLRAHSGTPRTSPAPEPEAAPAPPIDPADAAEEEESPIARPAQELNLDQETQLFISQSITDVDLYSSYGLTDKALELLDTILQRAPDYPAALERLLDLSVGMNDEARAVDLASRLERIYRDCGDRAAADRFADLRRRFERNGASAPAADERPVPAAEVPPEPSAAVPTVDAESYLPAPSEQASQFEIPVVDAQPEFHVTTPAADSADRDPVVHEVDLSEEWAAMSGKPAEVPADDQGLEAHDATADYESLLDGNLESEFAAETPAAPAAQESENLLEEIPSADDSSAELVDETAEPAAIEAVANPAVEDLLEEYERVLSADSKGPAALESAGEIDNFMRSISAELDAILPAEPPARISAPPASVPAANGKAQPPAESRAIRGPLGDIFDDFRAEMGESGEKEDPETHYNLGIAYREMGLVDEAISEFQKVANAHQQGQPFRYAMQCYTLLALGFVEKGQPSIAVSWYERALQVPGLDPETVLALRYDLGVSQELAGDIAAAQKSFSQVYGTNIDYRDVAERLAVLGRSR